jgi:MFS transporter, ACS family, hexuronate transporter
VARHEPAAAMTGSRSAAWKWGVCGLLLLASAINYMDRQTLAGASVRISREFHLNQSQYGRVEEMFAYGFAAGSLVFGWLADRTSVRRLYAVVLTLWSLSGLATGWAESYGQLIGCRLFLGFFEAGHWPCAIRTTRLLLSPRERSLGNGMLQSGASAGAIVTPLILRMLMGNGDGQWRTPFIAVGCAGLLWLAPWLAGVREADVVGTENAGEGRPTGEGDGAGPSLAATLCSGRMLAVLAVIACINTTWQVLRAWLMKFLQQGRGYSEADALYFNSAWFMAADLGCLLAGALATRWAVRLGGVRRARFAVFAGCGLLCASTVFLPWLGRGPLLLAVLAAAAAGALGLFPIYHAFTQDLPARYQGRITGVAGVAGWLAPAQAQWWFGRLADARGSFDLGLAVAGCLPLAALGALWLGWRRKEDAARGPADPSAAEVASSS